MSPWFIENPSTLSLVLRSFRRDNKQNIVSFLRMNEKNLFNGNLIGKKEAKNIYGKILWRENMAVKLPSTKLDLTSLNILLVSCISSQEILLITMNNKITYWLYLSFQDY